jgi:hypothetical protein
MDVADQSGLEKRAEAYDVPADVLAVGAGTNERLRRSTYAVIALDTLGDLPAEFRRIMRLLAQNRPAGQTPLRLRNPDCRHG